MRAALFGALGAREIKPPVSVLLDSHQSGLVLFPADMNYVTIVAINAGGVGGDGGDDFGGSGGTGGNLSMIVNLPKGAHTGVSMDIGNFTTTARWDFSEGTVITLALKHLGGQPSFVSVGRTGGGGGGRGGTESDGSSGIGTLGGAAGTDAAIFSALSAYRGKGGNGGGDGVDGASGEAWGGGGGGGGAQANHGFGAGGGALLVFSEVPIAYP